MQLLDVSGNNDHRALYERQCCGMDLGAITYDVNMVTSLGSVQSYMPFLLPIFWFLSKLLFFFFLSKNQGMSFPRCTSICSVSASIELRGAAVSWPKGIVLYSSSTSDVLVNYTFDNGFHCFELLTACRDHVLWFPGYTGRIRPFLQRLRWVYFFVDTSHTPNASCWLLTSNTKDLVTFKKLAIHESS